ncbi:hypothetical protein M1D34_31250 (plasmid) [Ensifer sp. D2-11]
MAQRLTLTSDQRRKIEEAVGHKLTEKVALTGSPRVTLILSDEQRRIVKAETGKDLESIELKEEDLKTLSNGAAYENGLVPGIGS